MTTLTTYGLKLSACLGLLALATSLCAATATSPNLSGTWTGGASGTSYYWNNNSPTTEPARAPLTATLTQTGNDLTIVMVVSPPGETPIALNLTGKAGDFALWARGINIDTDGSTEQVFLCGHFTTKGNKISGNLLFGGNSITYVTYSLSKTVAAALKGADQPVLPPVEKAKQSDDPPFNVAGKANGKTYTFATNAKAVKYTAAVTGRFAPAANTVQFTFVAADGSQQVFDATYGDVDSALALLGQSGSDTLIMFLKTGETSGAGTGWIFSDSRLVEFKISVKQQ